MLPIVAVVLLGAGAALFSRLHKNEEAEREALTQVKEWKLTFGDVTVPLEYEIRSLLGQLGHVSEGKKEGTTLTVVWTPHLRQASRWNYPAQRWPNNLVSQEPVV